MEFKVISLKTTTLHSGVVEKNKFISITKNGYKGMVGFLFISISTLNITKKISCIYFSLFNSIILSNTSFSLSITPLSF